jgi:hypothetical protein
MAECSLAIKEPHHCQHHESTQDFAWSMDRIVPFGKILSPMREMNLDFVT